ARRLPGNAGRAEGRARSGSFSLGGTADHRRAGGRGRRAGGAAVSGMAIEPGPLLRRLAPPPDEIEALSVSRLAADAGDVPWQGDEQRLALQIAYAVGDTSVLGDLV